MSMALRKYLSEHFVVASVRRSLCCRYPLSSEKAELRGGRIGSRKTMGLRIVESWHKASGRSSCRPGGDCVDPLS